MIQSGLASLSVLSDTTDPDVITEVLGLTPDQIRRKGEVLHRGRIRTIHAWLVDVNELDNTEADETGTRALRELLDRCTPAVGRIADLPADCEARIWWSAYSDSSQGGFVLPIELTVQLAALGVDLFTTVYLQDDEDAEEA
ncbi:DUF4279 domain-containing protein [Microbacterium sp.]|uniref:DUF4279 domain-containing protein n=1 Tax=Microbacterium sp. TaxID=51671 RepID=UPI002FDF6339